MEYYAFITFLVHLCVYSASRPALTGCRWSTRFLVADHGNGQEIFLIFYFYFCIGVYYVCMGADIVVVSEWPKVWSGLCVHCIICRFVHYLIGTFTCAVWPLEYYACVIIIVQLWYKICSYTWLNCYCISQWITRILVFKIPQPTASKF